MHKKKFSDKLSRGIANRPDPIRGGASRHNAGTVKPARGQPDSVKDLLARANPLLAGLTRRVQAQQDLKSLVLQRLPPPLATHVTEVLEKEGELTVFAESAAWAGRLRYAVEALQAALATDRPDIHIKSVRIRIMPRSGGST